MHRRLLSDKFIADKATGECFAMSCSSSVLMFHCGLMNICCGIFASLQVIPHMLDLSFINLGKISCLGYCLVKEVLSGD